MTDTELIDQDELQEALDAGLVSARQFLDSHAEAERVRVALLDGSLMALQVALGVLGLSQT